MGAATVLRFVCTEPCEAKPADGTIRAKEGAPRWGQPDNPFLAENRTYKRMFSNGDMFPSGWMAVSEQIGLRRAGEFRSLQRCKIPSDISTVHLR